MPRSYSAPAGKKKAKYTEDERAAMRSYLQRVEVRLSTMHRVAGAFIGGAGLLVLFPVFFRDIFTGVLKALVPYGTADSLVPIWLPSLLIAVPFLVSLFIPTYALYLLLRDLVHFYFVGHSPGFPQRLFNPRFALSGIAFSPDESPNAKREVMKHEYSTDLINFILPFGEDQADYFSRVITNTNGEIIPPERVLEELVRSGVVRVHDPHNVVILTEPEDVVPAIQIKRFNAAMGLAGVRDRYLVEEVAKGEASLIRHAISLRRLVLRYMKALLMFILTALASFMLLGFLEVFPSDRLLVLSVGYLMLSFFTPVLVRRPVAWIEHLSRHDADHTTVEKDTQLKEFETKVMVGSVIAGVSAALALVTQLLP